jgi:hypothetical protein
VWLKSLIFKVGVVEVPVSKKRVKKNQKKVAPPAPKALETPKKKKLTTQQILIYVISILVIVSMAIGYLASGNGRAYQPTPTPQSSVETPVAPTTEPTLAK